MGEAKRRKNAGDVDRTETAVSTSAACPEWSLSNVRAEEELNDWFSAWGIDPSAPGFHDSPAFLRAERKVPDILNRMARLVEARAYTPQYLADVERKIRIATEAVALHVQRDPRQGLCVVASGVLSRMLDPLGIWNYTAKSNLSVHFPASVSAQPRFFYSIDTGRFTAAHAVVVAPPFTIIDVTLKRQPYDSPAMSDWLPAIVASRHFKPYSVTPDEIIAPEIRSLLQSKGQSARDFLMSEKPAMMALMKQIPGREIELEGGRLGYGIVAVAGYQEPLAELSVQGCGINGMTPLKIFELDVLPKL